MNRWLDWHGLSATEIKPSFIWVALSSIGGVLPEKIIIADTAVSSASAHYKDQPGLGAYRPMPGGRFLWLL